MLLGWPCRLLDVDIGVDAQIEILDEHKISTGEFIAVQIKTTGSHDGEDKALYLDKIHVEYWKRLEVAVMIARVHLSSQMVRYAMLDLKKDYLPRGRKKVLRVIAPEDFEELSSYSAEKLRDSTKTQQTLVKFKSLLLDAAEIENRLFYMKRESDGPGISHLVDAYEEAYEFLFEARTLLSTVRHSKASRGYALSLRRFERACERLLFVYEEWNFGPDWGIDVRGVEDKFVRWRCNL